MSSTRKKENSQEALSSASDEKRIGGSQVIAEGKPRVVTLCYMGNRSQMTSQSLVALGKKKRSVNLFLLVFHEREAVKENELA